MYQKNKIIIIALSVFSFIGCEGYVDYSGIVYDSETKKPLDSVKCVFVTFKDYNYYIESDSLGLYNISTPLVGCVPDCGNYDVEFSKKGYKTQIVYAPTNIYLEKE